MSKLKGNVLNPLKIMEQYGTDALRFALSTGTSPGNDIKLVPSRLEAGRNFANKLWNAARFVIRGMEGGTSGEMQRERLPVEDRWILSRLNRTVAEVSRLMDEFQFGEAQRHIYDFLWGEFCDWYIELAKIRQRTDGMLSPVPVLAHVLETSLRLLHPYMPFLTEELWQHLRRYRPDGMPEVESIMVADYPRADDSLVDPEAERVVAAVIEAVHAIRNVRAEHRVASHQWIEARIYAGEFTGAVAPYAEAIQTLARVKPVAFGKSRPAGTSEQGDIMLALKDSEVVIPLASMVDVAAERQRLQQEIDQYRAEVARLAARLQDRAFLTKAPAEVIEREQGKLAERRDRLERMEQQLNQLPGLKG
ncbi:MAG: class I tRNA ligase family protein, partial [Chloroflexota bacterium]